MSHLKRQKSKKYFLQLFSLFLSFTEIFFHNLDKI